MTLNEYLEKKGQDIDRIVANCVKYFGPYKEDGTPRKLFPDDFWEGFIFEEDHEKEL